MNGITKEIAALLNVTLDEALKVQNYIDRNWLLHYSTCSQRKFNSVVKQVAKAVLA